MQDKIKWPGKKKVVSEAISVIIGTIIVTILIAAGDELGMFLLSLFV